MTSSLVGDVSLVIDICPDVFVRELQCTLYIFTEVYDKYYVRFL